MSRAELGPQHLVTIDSTFSLGKAYDAGGKYGQGFALSAEAPRLQTSKLGPGPPEALVGMNPLADARGRAGEPELAVPVLDEVFRLREAAPGPEHYDTRRAMERSPSHGPRKYRAGLARRAAAGAG